MSHHIGIVTCSPPGASLCFEVICSEVSKLARDQGVNVEVSVHAHAFDEYMRYIEAGDWDGVGRLLLSSARKLSAVGAEFVLLPCNTVHQALSLITGDSPIPWLHVGEEVAREARARGFRRIALLGTSLVMEGEVYPPRLAAFDIEYQIPNKADRERLDRFIFDEMVRGKFTNDARVFLLDLIQTMRTEGCDAAGLCCTELPILLGDANSPMPVLDSTRVLAHVAVRRLMVALGSKVVAAPQSSGIGRMEVPA